MKDSTDKSNGSETIAKTSAKKIEDTLRTEARRIPVIEQPRLVTRVMQHVRTSPRLAENEGAENGLARMPWLIAGATATAAAVVAIAVTSVIDDSPTTTLPRQANLPYFVEARIDPVLASREQDLAGELQRIRADLDSIGRMVSIRLESDPD